VAVELLTYHWLSVELHHWKPQQ